MSSVTNNSFGASAAAASAAAPDRGQEAPAMDQFMVCMSVVLEGSHLAFAAYKEETNTIVLEECHVIDSELQDVTENVAAIVQPTLLLVSNKVVADEKLLGMLTNPPAAVASDEGDGIESQSDSRTQRGHGPTTIPYQALKSSSFDVRNCKALILQNLRVASLMRSNDNNNNGNNNPQQGSTQHQGVSVSVYHALASMINFDSKVQIQALGSLLFFLKSTIFCLGESMSDEGDPLIIVDNIQQANALQYMTVSADTLSALHIFSTERHPLAVAKGHGNSKEGFSLFSLLDRNQSPRGRERMREWMLKPLVDCSAINKRQDGVELFLLSDLVDDRSALLDLLARTAHVEKILTRIGKCVANPQDFLALVRSLESAMRMFTLLRDQVLMRLKQLHAIAEGQEQMEDGPEVLVSPNQFLQYIDFVEAMIQRSNFETLAELTKMLKDAIDLEATSNYHSVVIRRGYDQELDNLKDQYAALSGIMQEIAEDLRAVYQQLGESLDIIFLPQIGFHIRIPSTIEDSAPDALEFVYREGEYSYFKDPETRKLDDEIGDIDGLIKDREAILLARKEDCIMECKAELQMSFEALADLDVTLAFANVALDREYVRPHVVPAEQKCILIRNGRHPLHQISLGNSFVPNDTSIEFSTRLNILTGPNYSGKSSYARQVGVLVFMAQIGCFVPCDAARISIFRQLYCRFNGPESCAVPQSSFQLDLSQMGSILRRSGPSSLVLVDEFGKGTSPASGIALLAAALQKLAESEAMTICTTHFLEVFSMGLLKDGHNGCKAMRMEVEISKTNPRPLFRLQEGVASSSAGLYCAKLAGLKPAILDRGAEIIQATKTGSQVQPLTELLRDCLGLNDAGKHAVAHFINTNWSQASKDEMEELMDLSNKM